MRSALFILAGLIASEASAVPPPPDNRPQAIGLKADNCPMVVTGSVRPYSPFPLRFEGQAGDELILVVEKVNPDLLFSLLRNGQLPLITDAGFGAGEVRIVLPESGSYDLQVSAFDATAMRGTSADFTLKLILRPAERGSSDQGQRRCS